MEANNTRNFTSKFKSFTRSNPALIALILSVVLFAVTVIIQPSALNLTTVGSLILLTSLLCISSAGQTIVLIGGGMDFSVGAVMSSAAIITTYVMNGKDGRFLKVFILAMAMGALVGLFNGICVVAVGLPPMIVTLAISNVVTRLEYVFTQGSPGGYTAPGFTASVINRLFGVIPYIIFYVIIIFPIVYFLLHRSRFGKQVYLIGCNPVASRLTGVKVNKIKILTYVISGLLSAFAGILGAAYIGTAKCQLFDDYAFSSLIAVIVGGTSISGGIGTFTGTIAGSFLMVVLSNTLTTMALSQPLRNIFNGVLIILLLIMYNRSKSVRQ